MAKILNFKPPKADTYQAIACNKCGKRDFNMVMKNNDPSTCLLKCKDCGIWATEVSINKGLHN